MTITVPIARSTILLNSNTIDNNVIGNINKITRSIMISKHHSVNTNTINNDAINTNSSNINKQDKDTDQDQRTKHILSYILK